MKEAVRMKKKKYLVPQIRRVQLEDKPVVAMAACNQFLEDQSQAGATLQGDQVVDRFGNPLLSYDPSL
jgi:hypothetical protein